MKVNVIYSDGTVEAVPSSMLRELISLREIIAFQRAEGWVYIGQAPLRRKMQPFKGPGQRAYDVFLDNSR
jgi:hypothetical protein